MNRRHRDRELTQEELPGLHQVHRLASGTKWVLSATPAHPALVSERDFLAAQAVSALPRAAGGTTRTYLLVGLLRCALCARSLESQWSHGNPCYRCRHGHTTAHPPTAQGAANLHLREDVVISRILAQVPRISSDDPHARHHLALIHAAREPGELARFLHAYAITIICDQEDVALETDSTEITVGSNTRRTAQEMKTPHQRSRTATKRDNRQL